MADTAQDQHQNATGVSAEGNTNNPLSKKLRKVLDTRLDNDKVNGGYS